MSLSLNFEPHSWYMGLAIQKAYDMGPENYGHAIWYGYTDNGNTYQVDELEADTLADLKKQIRAYHLKQHNGYGERYAKRRLNYLRGEIDAERISTSEILELESLVPYIEAGDVELLQWANVPEFEEAEDEGELVKLTQPHNYQCEADGCTETDNLTMSKWSGVDKDTYYDVLCPAHRRAS
jgi:hypothetical protein